MITILTGNVLDTLPTLPANSVQCCVTSPPYWGLRDYGTGTWEGGDAGCDHKPTEPRKRPELTGGGCASWSTRDVTVRASGECPKCGARRIDQQLGSEATPQEYVANMVAVFREVKRVLRDDGTLWLNLGDSYNAGTNADRQESHSGNVGRWSREGTVGGNGRVNAPSLKPKDLCGIPWRVAFALQEDGWWLRSAITWCKKAPMPESVTDRPTSATEKIFLLTKSSRYFYDAEAVREPMSEATKERDKSGFNGAFKGQFRGTPSEERWQDGRPIESPKFYNEAGRNQRNFWLLGPEPYAEAHFATFPTEIPRRAILAGTSAHGACPTCGAPWERVVERSGGTIGNSWHDHSADLVSGMSQTENPGGGIGNAKDANGKPYTVETIGFAPTCTCGHEDTVPCVVLDPFTGSGTTGAVARTLGRDFIGCELNPEYVKLAEKRIGHAQPALFGI